MDIERVCQYHLPLTDIYFHSKFSLSPQKPKSPDIGELLKLTTRDLILFQINCPLLVSIFATRSKFFLGLITFVKYGYTQHFIASD